MKKENSGLSAKDINYVRPLWETDRELFSIARRELFTALVGDVMDKLGYFNQFLSPVIKPASMDMVVIGRAMPVMEEDLVRDAVFDARGSTAKPFGMMLEALDDLQENEVYICSGASPSYALWGGLMSTRAMKLGAAGVVLHGYWRDTHEVLKLKFPTFGMGAYAQDQEPRGRVIGFRETIKMGDIVVDPGDIVFGDIDGVVVVPRKIEKAVFSGAIEKARGEKQVRKALEQGMSSVEAFQKFGLM